MDSNNCVTETFTDGYTQHDQKIYERQGTSDILKSSTETTYSKTDMNNHPSEVITKTYNSNGNYITKENSYTYNDYGKVLTETLTVENNVKLEHTYMYSNNAYKSLLNHTVKKGNVIYTSTDYTVNDLGDITTQFIYNGDNEMQSKTAFTYNSNNNPLQTSWYKDNTNEIIKNEKYVYGTDGYLSRVYTTDSEGTVIANESYTYDNMGRVIETKDINKTEQVEYDSQGRVVKEIHKDGSYTTIGYDHSNSIISVTDENGYYCEYQYNQMGLPYKLTDESDGEYTDLQTFTYDTMGNVISVKDALNNTTNITYDFLGRQTSVKYPGNTQTVKAKYYDVFLEGDTKYSVYLTISETGRISCEYYDVYGRLVKTALIKNYSSFSESDFDDIYQMPSNAQLIITSRYVYDDLDRVIEQYDGENRPTYYTYDSNMIKTPQYKNILQSSNLYIYGINNPIHYIDIYGLAVTAYGFVATVGAGFVGYEGMYLWAVDDVGNFALLAVNGFSSTVGASLGVIGMYFPTMPDVSQMYGHGFGISGSLNGWGAGITYSGNNAEYEGYVIQGGIGGNIDIWVGGDGSYSNRILSGNIYEMGSWMKSLLNKILPADLQIE